MNCYVCGHEILEGQQVDGWESGEGHEVKAHLNPADHLPTRLEGGSARFSLNQTATSGWVIPEPETFTGVTGDVEGQG